MPRFVTLLCLFGLLSAALFHGRTDQAQAAIEGMQTEASLALLSLSPGWSWAEATQQGSEMGAAVSSAGDVNNDGYADVIVGAPKYDDGGEKVGAVLVFLGSAGGLCIVNNPLDVCTPDWIYIGEQKGALLGASVAAAGHINDDEYDDVIVGAPLHKEGSFQSGAVFVFFGKEGGLCSFGEFGCPAPWKLVSLDKNAQFGFSVASGYVDDDKYADVIVGAPTYGDINPLGQAYIFRGSQFGLETTPTWTLTGEQLGANFGWAVASADVNNNGLSDVLISAPNFDDPNYGAGKVFLYSPSLDNLNLSPVWEASGQQAGALFGANLQSAGDVNGDKFEEIVISTNMYNTDQPDVGGVFVYYGSWQGLTTNRWFAESEQSYSGFGFSASGAGDFNNDGYDDLVVGANRYDESVPNDQGAIFIYLGGPNGLNLRPLWQALGAKADAYLGHSVAGAGDVNKDGCDDIIAGSPGYFLDQTLVGEAEAYYGRADGSYYHSIHIPLLLNPADTGE